MLGVPELAAGLDAAAEEETAATADETDDATSDWDSGGFTAASTEASVCNAEAATDALLDAPTDAASVLVAERECLIIGCPAPATTPVDSAGLAEEPVGASL